MNVDTSLSSAQARLWLLSQLTGPDPQYNIPLLIRFPGEIEAEAMQAALRDVVARHEILRTSYRNVRGRPELDVVESNQLPDLLTVEACPANEQANRARDISEYGFDLATQLPLRAWLLSGPQGTGDLLVVLVHHIAADEASLEPLLEDLGIAYIARQAGSAPAWQPLRLQYCDYTGAQKKFLGNVDDPSSLAAQQLEFWTSQLSELPEQTLLPTDRARPTVPDTRGAGLTTQVPEELHHRILELARVEQVSPFTLLKAAFAAFLSRQCASDDIPLAGFVTGRFDGEFDSMIGFFVNTLIFRVDTSGSPSFHELVRRTQSVDVAAYGHQDIPFEEVVRALNPPRSSQRHPLAQVSIAYLNRNTYRVPGTDALMQIGETLRGRFDLHISIVVPGTGIGRPEGMIIEWVYAVSLFDEETIKSMAHRFPQFLDGLLRDPNRRGGPDGLATQ